MRTSARLVILTALAGLLLSACGPALPPGAAAVVGDVRIPRDTIEQAMAGLDFSADRAAIEASLPDGLDPAERRAAVEEGIGSIVEDAQRRVLELFIRLELVRVVAAGEDVAVTDADREAARDQLITSVGGPEAFPNVLAQSRFTEEVFERAIVEQEALIAALQVSLLADATLEVREPRHILVTSQQEAEEVLAELDAGTAFEEVALARSQDPGSANAGGALPASPRGTWLAEFDQAVWSADLGEIVGPVQTAAGFHIIEVVDIATVAADELSAEQRQRVVAGELDERFFAAVDATEVRVDPTFGAWSGDPTDPSLRPVEPVGVAPQPAAAGPMEPFGRAP